MGEWLRARIDVKHSHQARVAQHFTTQQQNTYIIGSVKRISWSTKIIGIHPSPHGRVIKLLETSIPIREEIICKIYVHLISRYTTETCTNIRDKF